MYRSCEAATAAYIYLIPPLSWEMSSSMSRWRSVVTQNDHNRSPRRKTDQGRTDAQKRWLHSPPGDYRPNNAVLLSLSLPPQ
jgi:hypothetical protein